MWFNEGIKRKLFISIIFFLLTSTATAQLGLKKLVMTTPSKAPFWHRSNSEITTNTQYVNLEFYTGSLFNKNPNAHLWIALDGDLAEMPLPIRGRGIAFGDTHTVSGCQYLAFEHFGGSGNGNTHPGSCGNVPIYNHTWYKIKLHASTNWVAYWVYQKINGSWVLKDNDHTYMPSLISGKSDIIMGVAFDNQQSSYTVRNVNWGTF